MTVSNESSRQTFMDNEVEEDREKDGPTSTSTTWRTCGSRWRTQGIVPNGEAEPMWLTPHQRDSQPGGERERERERERETSVKGGHVEHCSCVLTCPTSLQRSRLIFSKTVRLLHVGYIKHVVYVPLFMRQPVDKKDKLWFMQYLLELNHNNLRFNKSYKFSLLRIQIQSGENVWIGLYG